MKTINEGKARISAGPKKAISTVAIRASSPRGDKGEVTASRVLFGEILPPKGKRAKAVALDAEGKAPQPRKGISTALQAEKAKPGMHKVSGVAGLYLKVGETGAGSYVYRYRLGDKRPEMGLGSRKTDASPNGITLAKARVAAQDADALRREGLDPIDERRRKRAENIARSLAPKALTFEQMAMDYLKAHGDDWKHKYARAVWLNPLVKFAHPVIGKLGLDQIEIAHILAVVDAADEAGVKETGRRIRARIERVISAAIVLSGKARPNPADGKLIAAARPSKRKGMRPHYRAVDLDDAPKMFQALKAWAEISTALAAWCFMIACALRPSEALNTRWNEVDLDENLLVIHDARMKSAREHRVPLSTAAIAILKHQASIRTGDAVFPGLSGSSLSYNSFATAPMKAGIDAACPHGWRSVFRDWAGDIGDVKRDLAEAALAHSLGSTEASYRRLTAVEKRRKVMEQYSQWLNSESAKIIPLVRAKA